MSSLLSILKMAGIVCVLLFPVTWLRRSLVWSQTPAELTSPIRASEHPLLGWGVGLAQPASNPTHSEQRGRPEFIWKRFKDLQKIEAEIEHFQKTKSRTWLKELTIFESRYIFLFVHWFSGLSEKCWRVELLRSTTWSSITVKQSLI